MDSTEIFPLDGNSESPFTSGTMPAVCSHTHTHIVLHVLWFVIYHRIIFAAKIEQVTNDEEQENVKPCTYMLIMAHDDDDDDIIVTANDDRGEENGREAHRRMFPFYFLHTSCLWLSPFYLRFGFSSVFTVAHQRVACSCMYFALVCVPTHIPICNVVYIGRRQQ